MDALAKKLQAASDPRRLKILCFIFEAKKACVSDIASKLGMSVAIASHHLHALAQEDILKPRREGKRVCYSLSGAAFVSDLRKFICKYK